MLGVFPGEGVGPEVVRAALAVLDAVRAAVGLEVEIVEGGVIGHESESAFGQPLSEPAVALCEAVFARGGAILHGPGGGRFVYDLRRRFDLFCKLVPLRAHRALVAQSRLKPEHVDGVDIVLVRDNAGGIYQGTWDERTTDEGRFASHTFGYAERDVRAIVAVAVRIAAARRGELLVVVKEGGVPTVSRLWRDVAEDEARAAGIRVRTVNVDLAAYQLIQSPRSLDVVAAPNLIGDVLADLGAVIEGGRGVSCSGNFTPSGLGVYQTNHGAAYDLAGSDRANPVGQILSLAMLLRESFGRGDAARLIETAVEWAWRRGALTDDLARVDRPAVGCVEMGARVAAAVADVAAASA
ncbi:MAG: isocitrate/isopropylmalate family dehydrogenase [Myxococcota bacterium]